MSAPLRLRLLAQGRPQRLARRRFRLTFSGGLVMSAASLNLIDPDEAQQASLDLVEVTLGSLYKGFQCWIAICNEAGAQVAHQRQRRATGRFCSIREGGGQMQRYLLGHREADREVLKYLVGGHRIPAETDTAGLYAAYLSFVGWRA